jgi:hypothetical protein
MKIILISFSFFNLTNFLPLHLLSEISLYYLTGLNLGAAPRPKKSPPRQNYNITDCFNTNKWYFSGFVPSTKKSGCPKRRDMLQFKLDFAHDAYY